MSTSWIKIGRREDAALVGYYSRDYFTARRRFAAAGERLSFVQRSLAIDAPSPNDEPLSIDIAVGGSHRPRRALVVSSGVHGVEGFFGSAVQLAALERLPEGWQPGEGTAVVFIHALNPFGFAWQRRFNEDNIDLNRNFLLADEAYSGAPPLCGMFRETLMRRSNLPRLNPAASRLALIAMRHGVRSFWENLPVGQYEYPDWLFFGGRGRSQAAQRVDEVLPQLFGSCEEVVHLDFHTGLGRWAEGKLLLNDRESPDDADWWRARFGSDRVSTAKSAGAYQIRGGFGAWLQSALPKCRYRFATAEFGTYSPLRVITALAEELHWHAKLGTQSPDHWARRRLTEAFAPRDTRWRVRTLQSGLALIDRAADALVESSK